MNPADLRAVRRCALLAMYQFDLGGEPSHDEIARSLRDLDARDEGERLPDEPPGRDLSEDWPGTAEQRKRGLDLATLAWEYRDEADEAVRPLVTEWPTHRQPALDRNILRLAFYEFVHGGVPAKVAIVEAVELAKDFCGENSPRFVNGVLDRLWKSREGMVTAPAGGGA
jgi:transcription antitermination factor NusB